MASRLSSHLWVALALYGWAGAFPLVASAQGTYPKEESRLVTPEERLSQRKKLEDRRALEALASDFWCRAYPPPVVDGHWILWAVDLEDQDIYGENLIHLRIWLDGEGEAWVQDLGNIVAPHLRDQLEWLLKEGTPKDRLFERSKDLLLERRILPGSRLSVPRLREVLRAWAALPPPTNENAAVAHLGTDVYGTWHVSSRLPPRKYVSREYVLALARAWAETMGAPQMESSRTAEGVYGGFEWVLGDWVLTHVLGEVRKTWLIGQTPAELEALMSPPWVAREGSRMLRACFAQGDEAWPLAEALMAKGVRPNIPDKDGWLPGLAAFETLSAPVAMRLLDKGITVDSKDASGNTPLYLAVGNEKYGEALARGLLAKGASVDAVNANGDAPLHLAVRMLPGGLGLVRALLDAGADPRRREGRGWTPLHLLAVEVAEDCAEARAMARLLVAKGADPAAVVIPPTGGVDGFSAGRLAEAMAGGSGFKAFLRALRLSIADQGKCSDGPGSTI